MTKDEFIKKATDKHGSKYDYSLLPSLLDKQGRVKIGCPVHGVFEQRVYHHYYCGSGCQLCGNREHITTARFIEQAKAVHGNKYTYDKAIYVKAHANLTITCPTHGDFDMTPTAHKTGKQGCPKCNKRGFNKDKPALLYVLCNGSMTKIGITNRDVVSRLKKINREHDCKFVPYATFHFATGEEAYKLENAVLTLLQQDYNNPTEIFDGSTETFVDLSPEVAIKKIVEAINPYH